METKHKYASRIDKPTKENYKKALYEVCDSLKEKADDILNDYDKDIREINIHLKLEYGFVSVISINKQMSVFLDLDDEKK